VEKSLNVPYDSDRILLLTTSWQFRLHPCPTTFEPPTGLPRTAATEDKTLGGHASAAVEAVHHLHYIVGPAPLGNAAVVEAAHDCCYTDVQVRPDTDAVAAAPRAEGDTILGSQEARPLAGTNVAVADVPNAPTHFDHQTDTAPTD